MHHSVTFPSSCHGVCSSINICVPPKGGITWQKCHFANIVNFVHQPEQKKKIDSPMLTVNWQVIKPASLEVLAELWLRFPEFKVVGFIVLARVLLL